MVVERDRFRGSVGGIAREDWGRLCIMEVWDVGEGDSTWDVFVDIEDSFSGYSNKGGGMEGRFRLR
jgi:hypothetical protein